MNTKRILAIATVLCALAVLLPVSGYAADGSKDPSVYFRPSVRFGTDHRTLYIMDLLVPAYRGNKDLLFVNAKFTPDDHDAWETNVGIGYRRLVLDDKLVLGGNFFYDHRHTTYGSEFDQIGLGVEAMTELKGVGLTTRLNYYQPLTSAKLGEDFGYVFYGNGIYTAGVEEPMTGFDYEGGVRIPYVSNYVETWAYAGGYHYFGKYVPDVNGFSARVEAIPTDFLRLSFEYRNDNINNDQYYGEVALEVPFSVGNLVTGKNPFAGMGDMLTGSRSLKDRMVEPVRRDVDIVVGKDYLSGSDAASGDGTYEEGIIFVSADAPSGGDGSFEHPYSTFGEAVNDAPGGGRLGNTIYTIHVLPGGSYSLSGYDFDTPGLTVWGAGATNPRYPNVANFVPGYPLVTSTIYMDAPNQTILGLDLETFGENAIEIGGGASGAGLSIFKNIINAYVGTGIYYSNGGIGGDLGAPGAPAVIMDNTIASLPGEGYGYSGVYLNSGGNVYARILNNRVGPAIGTAPNYGIYVYADEDFNGEISGNTVSDIESYNGYAAGIFAYADNDFNGTISGNTVNNVYAYNSMGVTAIGIYGGAGSVFYGSISGNSVNNVWGENAMGINVSGIAADGGDAFLGSINNNTITNIGAGDAMYVSATGISIGGGSGSGTGYYDGSISGNTISGISAGYGEYAIASGISVYTEDDVAGFINGNRISNIEADSEGNELSSAAGINVYTDYDVTASINNNTIAGIYAEDGRYTDASGILLWDAYNEYSVGYFGGSISENTISDVTATYAEEAYALAIDVETNDDVDGSISYNTISGITAYDADEVDAEGIYSWADGDYNGSILANKITGVSAYDADDLFVAGINAQADGSFVGSISDNTVSGLSGTDASYVDVYSIYVFSDNGDITAPITGNTVSDVTSDEGAYGIYAYMPNGSFTGTVSGNKVTGISGEYAEALCITASHNITGFITDNVLSATGTYTAYGADLDARTGSLGTNSTLLVFTGNSGTISAPAAYAAYLYANDPAASNLFIGFVTGSGMGKNNFNSATGTWSGNYPWDGGPIYASDYPTYNYINK